MGKKYQKSKVIEVSYLLTVPKNQLMKAVFISDSIESVILDLQEIHPDGKITRGSILSWKFLTVSDVKRNKELIKKLTESGVTLFGGRKKIRFVEKDGELTFEDIEVKEM
jgi:hypothetical protein